MQSVSDAERLQLRAERIAGWLLVYEEMYASLLSRTAETASISGFDDAPRSRPCEHPARRRQGKLCLECENTGWRKVRPGEDGVDPYSRDVQAGVQVSESASGRKAREGEHIDNIIEGLKRNARLRAGAEVPEGQMDRLVRAVSRKDATLKRILFTIARLRQQGVERITPELLALEVRGRIREP